MRRTTSRARRAGGPRRKLVWARSFGQFNVAAGTGNQVPNVADLLANFEAIYGAQLIGTTIMRVRGIMGVIPTSAYPAAGQSFIRATINVDDAGYTQQTTDSAFSTTGTYKDYMLFEPFFVTGSSAPSGVSTDLQQRVIDVRSRRKLDELNQSLYLQWHPSHSVAASTTVATWDLSLLVALP